MVSSSSVQQQQHSFSSFLIGNVRSLVSSWVSKRWRRPRCCVADGGSLARPRGGRHAAFARVAGRSSPRWQPRTRGARSSVLSGCTLAAVHNDGQSEAPRQRRFSAVGAWRACTLQTGPKLEDRTHGGGSDLRDSTPFALSRSSVLRQAVWCRM